MTSTTTAAHALPTIPALGSRVTVLPGYSSETRARTNIDAWTDRTMFVIKTRKDDVLLDKHPQGEGEVWIYAGRLVEAGETPADGTHDVDGYAAAEALAARARSAGKLASTRHVGGKLHEVRVQTVDPSLAETRGWAIDRA
jgi:hypothetical protein